MSPADAQDAEAAYIPRAFSANLNLLRAGDDRKVEFAIGVLKKVGQQCS
jgi:hypothetical protein